MAKLICLFFLMQVTVFNLMSQISYGGMPIWQGNLKCVSEQIPLVEMPDFDMSIYEQDDNLKSTRFAHPFFVSLTPDNSGKWSLLSDGTRVWRLAIRSTDAYSINLIFDKFKLPDGGKLFIFNNDLSSVIGAFTNKSSLAPGAFATLPVAGDEIIVEYSQDSGVNSEPDFEISAVNHDFKDLLNIKVGNFGDSGDCNVDATCLMPLADHLRSVVRLLIDGTEYCTGTLINNTLQDGKPYFITAAHCLNEKLSTHSFTYLFNDQVPDCNVTFLPSPLQSMTGGEILAMDATLDFMLINLGQLPPNTYRPYWSGWDLTTTPSSNTHTIHHPYGDVKKLSLSSTVPLAKSYNTPSFVADSHWLVQTWNTGTTEPGSSGAGLFTNEYNLIGTLSGGAATCLNPVSDYFSRINKSWNYFTESAKQLKNWMDPLDQNITKINGINYYEEIDQNVIRISNRMSGELPILTDSYIKGFWFGYNNNSIDGFAEKFDTIEKADLHGLYLMCSQSKVSGAHEISLKVWSNQIVSDAGSPLLDTIISISTSNRFPSEKYIELKKVLEVKYPVSISLQYNYTSSVDSIGFYFQAPSTSRNKNTAYLHQDGQWLAFNEVHPEGMKTSAYVELLTSHSVLRSTQVPNDIENGLVDIYPNPVDDQLIIKWGDSDLQSVDVYNYSGQFVGNKSFGYSNGTDYFDFSGYSIGMYLVKFNFSDKTDVRKVIVR